MQPYWGRAEILGSEKLNLLKKKESVVYSKAKRRKVANSSERKDM